MMVDPVEAPSLTRDRDPQLEALRARITRLETALRLVRDLMRDLPAHDNVATGGDALAGALRQLRRRTSSLTRSRLPTDSTR